MNILFVSGSRNPEGRTARAVNAVLEGAKEAGSDVELVFLPELNLERCRQCGQVMARGGEIGSGGDWYL